MRSICSIALLLLTASAAMAQQQSQSAEELQAQYLFETGQLRQALGQAQAQLIQLRKEIAELRSRSEPKAEPKK